jgi:hypothetical protein
MLLSHTPTGAAAPDLIFCAHLPDGQRHLLATRRGDNQPCPHPCALICPLQRGACVSPPPLPTRLTLALDLSATLARLLEQDLTGPVGCLIGRN